MQKFKNSEREKELLRRVKAAGIPVDVYCKPAGTQTVIVIQDTERYDSEVFDCNGGTGIFLPIKIVSQLPVFVFSNFSIEFDRWRGWFRPLEAVEDPAWPRYEFHGREGLKFNRAEVINRFVSEGKVLRAGHPMQGLLLASSFDAMPDDIRRGEVLNGIFRLFDQFGTCYSTKIRVRAERQTAKITQDKPEIQRN